MRRGACGLLASLFFLPAAALADDTASSPPSSDVFSYSILEVNHLHEHSDYFADSSSGNGLKFSYDFPGEVYLFGQWNKFNFDSHAGSHTLRGLGVGAHQAYSASTSFYIDLSYLQDQLSGFSSASENYWRVSYGFRSQATNLLEFDAAIFTERKTHFGRRPFGERAGFGLDFNPVSLLASVEHTADGNRTELQLIWAYR